MASYIPSRIKRARRQIAVKLYEDQLAMFDSYARFIDDSREYIISQALEMVFKKDKDFTRWLQQRRNSETVSADPNAKDTVILPAEPNEPQAEGKWKIRA